MLIIPDKVRKSQHEDAKKGLRDQFNKQLEKILNENSNIDKYWILGKVKFPQEYEGKVGRVFLEGCLEKPPLVTEAFLYEVDNRKGTKTLLWVMNPGGSLRLPTLNKTINVQKMGENTSVATKKSRRLKGRNKREKK